MSLRRKIVSHIVVVVSIFLLSFMVVHAAEPKGSLVNPLAPEFSTIPQFIAGLLKAVVMIALPIITIFFVIIGFKFITAQGQSGKLEEAKQNFVWGVVGAALILGAWVLATLIAGTVTQLVGK